MTTLSLERVPDAFVCNSMLHKLGQDAVQTADLLAHNNAVRGIIAEGFTLVGAFAVAECVECHEQVKTPTYALIVDPLV